MLLYKINFRIHLLKFCCNCRIICICLKVCWENHKIVHYRLITKANIGKVRKLLKIVIDSTG